MESKDVLERLLAQVPRDKRIELTEKLRTAASAEDRVAILEQYGVETNNGAPEWLADSYELSDEDLDAVAGGAPWDCEVGTNCCS